MNKLITALLLFATPLVADSKAKIDAGPAYIHLDILESGKTIERMDLPAIRADGSYLFSNGICIKPTLLYGSNNGTLFTIGACIGQYIPLNDQWSFLPNAGITYGYVRTTVNFPDYNLFHLRERFRSISPYVAIEAYYSLSPTLRLCGSFQYAWSRTHTDIQHLPITKSHCKGPNYSLLIEKDLNSCWSINLGLGYNISLSKEKHGLRGTGIKVGLARWY